MTENIFHAKDRFRPPTLLPEEFWAAHPVLAHIRESARRRMAPPDLTLGAVLARVAVLADPRLRIPPRPGYCSPLGLFVCGMAGSSGGKTTAMGVARELLPYGFPDCALNVMPASGETVLDAFWSEEEDENHKPVRVRSVSSALVSVDEGTLLTKLGERSGNTLVPFLLTMWTGQDVGTDTLATTGKRGFKRRLDADSYVLSVVVALQPKKAADLLSQRDSGFAQRFLWFSDKDPGALRGVPADHRIVPLQFRREWVGADHGVDGHPDVREARRTAEIEAELYDALWRKRQPDSVEDEMAGQDLLNRLRVAHNLALLLSAGGSADIDDGHWRLSELAMGVSCANRDAAGGVVRGVEDGKKRTRQAEAVETAIRIDLKRNDLMKLRTRKAIMHLMREGGGRHRLWAKDFPKSLRQWRVETIEDMLHDEVLGDDGGNSDRYYLR